ncbi:uncharacterized protein LODBEIA_P01660 [Lodderomyces beijingensis]|uniref:ferric-chelate reductase (NADPH) n=1 Tax=Lodderomyces beijingensis TaxID=1775926 RepID=A0ABP0ZIE2_9ASCO
MKSKSLILGCAVACSVGSVSAYGRPYSDNSDMSPYQACQAQIQVEVTFCETNVGGGRHKREGETSSGGQSGGEGGNKTSEGGQNGQNSGQGQGQSQGMSGGQQQNNTQVANGGRGGKGGRGGGNTCDCLNPNSIATLAGCLQAAGKTSRKYTMGLVQGCKRSQIDVPEDWFDDAIKRFNANAKSAAEIPHFQRSKAINVPFILNSSNTTLYQESYKRFYANYNGSLYYGAGILAYWFLVLLLGAVSYWSKILFPGFTKKMTNPVVNMWRKHVTVPAAFGRKKTQEQPLFKVFDFLIPSRSESIIIALFYGVVLLTHALCSTAVENDPRFGGSKYKAEIRYVADRSGITATMFMPLVFLFAGRNNFLQWATGWDFSTFMAFHRHTSRAMFMLVVIHAVCFTIALGSRYSNSVKRWYFIWGIVATVAGGIIMVQGMLFLRRRWYEIFLLIHIAMAVLWVVGTWYHVKDLGYIQLVYPTVAIWGVDRVVRILRLFYFGFPRSDVYLLADETLKVVVPKPKSWKSIPGGHAFIHFLKPTYFWQSHPFTFTDSVEEESCIVLYCKVKGGITHSLYKQLCAAPDRACKMRVAVEGPYGESTPAKYADTAVFIAGGNGIPGIYSEVFDIAKRSGHHHQNDRQQSLKLIWVVREWRSLYWFYQELLSLKSTNIETTIYVTQASSRTLMEDFNSKFAGSARISEDLGEKSESVEEVTKLEESSCDEKSATSSLVSSVKKELNHIEFREGRPDISTIVPEAIHESHGSVAFVTCGHSAMVDQIRYYCAENVDNEERKRVDFYEQVQVWA